MSEIWKKLCEFYPWVVLENIPVTLETIIVIIQSYIGRKGTFFPVNDMS